MKRFVLPILLLCALLLLPGCGQDEGNGNDVPDPQPQLSVEDLFPIKENVKYDYEGEGNEYAFYNVHIDYTSDNRVQQRVNNGGTETVKVIEVKDGKVTEVFSKGEVYYRENHLEKDDQEVILLQEPIKKGTTWTLEDSSTKTITEVNVDISVPAGSYKAVEVTTEGTHSTIVDYYVPDVGLVKSVWVNKEGGGEVSSSLRAIDENAVLVQNVAFYYPNIEDNQYYYKTKQIKFKTNDITRNILANAYKEPVGEVLGRVFSSGTNISSLYLNQDNRVYIDLNQAFLTEMNAGSLYESMILQSIANTFGSYYGVQETILTIDDQLYESGHIAFEKGEAMPVEVEGAVRID